MRIRCFYIIIFLMAIPDFVFSQDSTETGPPKYSLYGYIKDLPMLVDNPFGKGFLYANLIHNRTGIGYYPSGNFTTKVEFRNRVFAGSLPDEIPYFDELIGTDNGLVDLTYTSRPWNPVVVSLAIDRAWVMYRHRALEITAGRQRINWGLNTAWNPNDIFNAFNLFDFDYEERPGSDAVRVQYFTGGFSFVEVAASRGNSHDVYASAILYRFNRKGYDLQVLAGVKNNRPVAGGGWAGSIGNTGFKGEVTWYGKNQDRPGQLIGSPGIDFTFKDGWYFNVGYLFNSGIHANGGDIGLSAFSGLDEPFPFRHAGLIQVNKQVNPLLGVNAGVLYSSDSTLVVLPGLTYSLFTNWDLLLNGQFFESLKKNGSSTTSLFLRIRWSFAKGR